MKTQKQSLLHYGGVSYVIPFMLITSCFALWGFANDITNPMVKAFSKIFRMSVTDGALVQVAFYGGYFAMAFPAAMFIQRYSYKAGILLGLGLYAGGALLFLPAAAVGSYYPFLGAYFVLTCGLSFLETSANPYILSMGSPETATRRLNMAQAFNPIGSLMGMFVAMTYIQARLCPMDAAERMQLGNTEFEVVKRADLSILIAPYVAIGAVILVVFAVIYFTKMPKAKKNAHGSMGRIFRDLLKNVRYREGVVAQFFYMGAQIMCWTFIIQYGTHYFVGRGLDERTAEVMSQQYNIFAMVLFCSNRFVCTFLMKYVNPGKILTVLALMGALLMVGVIGLSSIAGLYCLVGVSACMSLMFPTIYGLSLKGMKIEDTKYGAAGLIMAILGGSVMPPLQAMIIDRGEIMGFAAVNLSFVLPLICFVVIAFYGYKTYTNRYN